MTDIFKGVQSDEAVEPVGYISLEQHRIMIDALLSGEMGKLQSRFEIIRSKERVLTIGKPKRDKLKNKIAKKSRKINRRK